MSPSTKEEKIMKVSLERNTQEDSEKRPYNLLVEIITATVNAGTTFSAPVNLEYKGTEKAYSVQLCGYTLVAPKAEDLVTKAYQFLPRVISIARFPTYVFIARRAGGIYPVYTIGNEVYATTPGGPVFRHVELAKVREYLTDYLHAAGILGEKGLSDKLHVRGINMHTLGLRRPILYLKKRVEGQIDFWAPVFEAGDKKHIYAYAANERREVPISAGLEVLQLQKSVASALIQDNRLSDQYDLRPGRLFPEYWERLKSVLVPQAPITVQGVELPVFNNGDIVIALESRPEENRYSLYLGANIDDLTQRAEADFARRGVTVEAFA